MARSQRAHRPQQRKPHPVTKLQKTWEQRANDAEERAKRAEAKLEELRTTCNNLKVRMVGRFGVSACKKVIATDDDLLTLARFAERTDDKEKNQ
jgi:hypothetical protein